MTTLVWLQNWYKARCDGEWEHGQGIRISTIDNPGWQISIPLRGTPYLNEPFEDAKREGESDWVVCRKRDGIFEGFGGVNNLQDILETFRSWVDPEDGGAGPAHTI
jgi:hypothetical protein